MERVEGECVQDGTDPTSEFLRGYMYEETRRYFATEAEFNAGVPATTHVAFEPVPPDDPNYYECPEGYTMLRPASIDRDVAVEYLGDYNCSGSCSSFYSLDDPDWGWQGSCSDPHFPFIPNEDEIQ